MERVRWSGNILVLKLVYWLSTSYMIGCHCICHREALACKAAAGECDYVSEYFGRIEHLGRYFQASAKRTSDFEMVQDELGEARSKIITSAFTRWLSHDLVTKSIDANFHSLWKSLQRDSQSDLIAPGLFNAINTIEFVAVTLLMRDVLPIVTTLSKKFQSADADMTVIETDLADVLSQISHLRQNPGHNVRTLQARITDLESKGCHLKFSRFRDAGWFATLQSTFLNSIHAHLHSMFPNMPVMSALYRLLNAKAYPSSTDDVLQATFLKHEFELVSKFYSTHPGIDTAILQVSLYCHRHLTFGCSG